MAAPLRPAGKDRDGQRRRGAVAAAGTADPNRKRRLAALAVLAALIVLAAVLIIVKLAGSSHHTASPARHPAAASVTPTSALAATPTPAAASSASAGTGARALPAFGLVGGGGVAARPATGKLAIKGSAGDVLFAEDGTALDGSARQVVTAAAREIRRHQPPAVTVTGYTDAIGNAAVNHRLSLQRARAVIRALHANLGRTAVRFRAEARGQGKPVAANSTAAGRQLNRRVVISLG